MIIEKKNIFFYGDIFFYKKKYINLFVLFNQYFLKNIKIFFYKNKNKIFFQDGFFYINLYLVNFFFFKLKKNELINSVKLIFIQSKKFFFFILNFLNLYNNFYNLYFFRLKLKGLGFNLQRFSKFLFRFLMVVNHFYYFFVPKFLLFKKRKKHLICISLDLIKLNTFFWNLLYLKKHNVYVRTRKINGFVKVNFVRFVRKKYKL